MKVEYCVDDGKIWLSYPHLTFTVEDGDFVDITNEYGVSIHSVDVHFCGNNYERLFVALTDYLPELVKHNG